MGTQRLSPSKLHNVYLQSAFISIARFKYLEGLDRLMNVYIFVIPSNIKEIHIFIKKFFSTSQRPAMLLAEIRENNYSVKKKRRDPEITTVNTLFHIIIDVRPYLSK